jgi:thiol:disulfide interchange protein DsbC
MNMNSSFSYMFNVQKVLSKVSGIVSVFLLASAFCVSNVSAKTIEQSISDKLETSLAKLKVASVVKTAWPGMYEVALESGAILFSDENAEYLMVGEMLSFTKDKRIVNLSQQKFQKTVAKELAAVPEKQQIIYTAENEKTSITVFTDISCFYCKKLHKAIPELQENGVTVKYMAFPRAGANSDIAEQMSAIWCAKDKAKAMTLAKQNGRVEVNECDSPVAQQFFMGNKLGVSATPTIFTEEGEKIAGFASVGDLLNTLGLQ